MLKEPGPKGRLDILREWLALNSKKMKARLCFDPLAKHRNTGKVVIVFVIVKVGKKVMLSSG